ncbi:MAG: hybrid sensor histidine kinase/response regulator [Anaerolineales bacterium]|nr:MAG: hybrid sensor histidine kinase/response regulator [Anaerolineales bacterium]
MAEEGNSGSNGAHILVVEDHEPLLAAIGEVLSNSGYQVTVAVDGVEALEAMQSNAPGLIVADIMMPRMDGYAFYEAVRRNPAWVSIPIIFLTAKAEKQDVLRGKAMGAEDYITKPFDPEELLVAVQARLRRAAAIRQAEEARFEAMKDEIVTILGHELRTPVTYIRGYADLALSDLASLSAEEVQEFLQGIRRGGERLTRLVESLLSVIRLDTGRAELEFGYLAREQNNVGDVITSSVRRYTEEAAAQGVTLHVELEPDLPRVRLCEPLFAEALRRLVDNAIKFSGGEGKPVTVWARTVDVWLEVAVKDEGVGIALDQIPHLFERFRQIDRDALEQQGVGLGLPIAQGFIELHGGEITVDSKVGKGSTFTIRLPALASK